MKQDGKDFGCFLAAAVIAIVVLVGTAVAIEAAGLQWYAPWKADKKTEIVRNTNQYVTTQQEAMADAWRRYNDPDATEGQKGAALDDLCRAANRIEDQYVNLDAAKAVMRARGCWNGS